MKKLNITISAALLLLSLAHAGAEVPFRILSSNSVSANTKNIDFIAQTSPYAKAWVNGEQVRVYSTGTFGNRIAVQPGENDIKVRIVIGKEVLEETVLVTRQVQASQGFVAAGTSSVTDAGEPLFVAKDMTVVTTDGAYIQYGDGNDRLGGSKMGFLDSGIAMKVTGEIGDLYKVRLSSQRFAYIDKSYVCEDATAPVVTVNSLNASVKNAGKTDRVIIPLGVRLPYSSWTELDPSRICVNIYGAMNNSNWISHYSNLEMVDNLDLRQIESDVLQAVISLKKQYQWGYSVHYEGNNLVISVKHGPKPSLKGMVIGLDAGHGGTAPGAVGVTGLSENTINLKLVYLLKDVLESKGAKVVLTRTSEEQTLSMTERKKILLDADVDMLVSIHNNSGGSPFVPMGTSVYYKHIANRPLAECIYKRMLELGVPEYGLVGNFNFSLCGPTEYPDVLVEALFLSSLEDEAMLHDPKVQKVIAKKIAAGIEDYLKKI